MQAKDLSVIIVNYNGKEDLPRCLAALEKVQSELELDVIVVDNGSEDGSIELAEERFPWVRYIRIGKNLGFAGGCNRGLAVSEGRHALLLNPDTEVMPGALHSLVRALEEHPSWGIVGPRMVDQHDRVYGAARRFPTPFYLFCETTRLAFFFPRTRLFAGYFYGEQPIEALDRVDQLEGSALLIRGEVRTQIGDLDERFFLFFEEVDWCKRSHDAGYENHVVPGAVVRHYKSTTMSRFYGRAREANARSAMLFFEKHHGARGLAKVRRWMRWGLLIREAALRLMLLLGAGERVRIKAEGARAERAIYRKGLGA